MAVQDNANRREATPMLVPSDLASLTFEQLAALHSHLADAHHATHLAWKSLLAATGNVNNPLSEATDAAYGLSMTVYGVFRAHKDHPLNDPQPAIVEIGTGGVKVRIGQRVFSANGNPGTLTGLASPHGHFVSVKLDNGRVVSSPAALTTPDYMHPES